MDGGSTASYVYDADGERVRKNSGSTWIEYVHGPGGVLCEYNGSSWTTQYVYAGNRLIAEYNTTTTEFVHSDSLGSTRLVTSMNQSVLDNLDYLPFGQQIAGGSVTTHKFTGKERDSESNLDNFGARYFTSTFGRFMTPDWAARPTAVPYAVFGDPQSLNLYAYVRNDPVTRADEDGHDVDVRPQANREGQNGLSPAECRGGGQEKCDSPQYQADQTVQNDNQTTQPVLVAQNQAPQNPQQPQPAQPQPLQYDNHQPHPPEPATGPILPVLQCMQTCSHFVISSTSEQTPAHPAGTPHRRNEAADLEVRPGQERATLQCAARCGARFGLDERAHPSARATGPHVHVQATPGRNGGRGDLPPQNQ